MSERQQMRRWHFLIVGDESIDRRTLLLKCCQFPRVHSFFSARLPTPNIGWRLASVGTAGLIGCHCLEGHWCKHDLSVTCFFGMIFSTSCSAVPPRIQPFLRAQDSCFPNWITACLQFFSKLMAGCDASRNLLTRRFSAIDVLSAALVPDMLSPPDSFHHHQPCIQAKLPSIPASRGILSVSEIRLLGPLRWSSPQVHIRQQA